MTETSPTHESRGCLLPIAMLGVVFVLVFIPGIYLVAVKSPVIVWKTSITVSSGAPVDPRDLKLKLGMAGTEIQKLLGPPQATLADADLELWTYERSVDERHDDRVLGLLRIGGGSGSSSSSCSMTLVGGRLFSASLPGLAVTQTRVMGRKVESLRNWSKEQGHTLSDNRLAFKPLGEITPGITVAADLDRILGPAKKITAKAALEYRMYAYEPGVFAGSSASSLSLHMPSVFRFHFEIFLKDGVVIGTPRDPCKDEELLKDFDEAEGWPSK